MSCYALERYEIIYLVKAVEGLRVGVGPAQSVISPLSWVYDGEIRSLPPSDPQRQAEVANMLWEENLKSVAYRYQDDQLPGPEGEDFIVTPQDVLDHHWPQFDPVQVLKACNHYEYQSCEHPEWQDSEAKAFIEALRRRAIHALPGYDDAEWGAPEPVEAITV